MKLIDYENEGKKYTYLKITNILNDFSLSNDKKVEILDNLLDINSLNRCYIMYFIFKKHGIFYASVDDKEPEAFNAYDEYLFWKNIYGTEDFNLDETQNTDLFLSFNNNSKYETCKSHINFVSWIYYSGLYDYLLSNNDIKKYILDEMCSKRLLTGNYFIRYLLFTSIYDNELHSSDYECDTDTNENNGDILSENDASDADDKYLSENEKELEKSRNNFNTDDIDNYKFLYELSRSTIDVSCRMYNNFRNTVREEVRELFRPPID
jgi:hypothetical protein